MYAAILALWFGARERLGRTGFYVLFALAVTVSVQLVGLYLVFATLIVPPLATRTMQRGRLLAAWALGALGYAIGLVVSTALDLPTRAGHRVGVGAARAGVASGHRRSNAKRTPGAARKRLTSGALRRVGTGAIAPPPDLQRAVARPSWRRHPSADA